MPMFGLNASYTHLAAIAGYDRYPRRRAVSSFFRER